MSKRKNQKLSRNHGDAITIGLPRLVIPLGNPFQANVPEWTGPPLAAVYGNDPDTLRFLGERTWPIQDDSQASDAGEDEKVGRGRPENCSCLEPRTVKCVNRHITQERNKLQIELQPAFWTWKFNNLGEKVSKSWTSKDRETFDSVVKMYRALENKDFLQQAMLALPSKSRENIVSHYFNVYVPNRIREQTRAGIRQIDTDDDEPKETSPSRSCGKRGRHNSGDEEGYSDKGNKYLLGRR